MTRPHPLAAWALKHHVSDEALADLVTMMRPLAPPAEGVPGGEAHAQSLVRLEAARAGIHLWRNNNGALKDENGRLVRFGLANDSRALNAELKSSDLIGVRPVTITPAMVGSTLGQFVAREMKAPGWTYRGDAHEMAQERFLSVVRAHGGDAAFATGPGSL